MTKSLEGGCLCGAVRYRTEAEPMVVGNCYCVDCRKGGSTSHATHVGIPEDSLVLEGQLSFYDRPADSGSVVSRGFCPKCGSGVMSLNNGMAGIAMLRGSSLDGPNAITPQFSVYTSRAPVWARIDPALPSFAEMPEGGPQSVIGGGPD
jgi:hypothetical protein